jgi:hypothetical protein
MGSKKEIAMKSNTKEKMKDLLIIMSVLTVSVLVIHFINKNQSLHDGWYYGKLPIFGECYIKIEGDVSHSYMMGNEHISHGIEKSEEYIVHSGGLSWRVDQDGNLIVGGHLFEKLTDNVNFKLSKIQEISKELEKISGE